jgi:hypothetical protein
MPISGVAARVDDDLVIVVRRACYLFSEQDLANIALFV